jgi:hypothetical protein
VICTKRPNLFPGFENDTVAGSPDHQDTADNPESVQPASIGTKRGESVQN